MPNRAENDRLWTLIDDAQAALDAEVANSLFRDAEKLAHDLRKSEPKNAEHCYAIALTYYHRWGESDERRICLNWLDITERLNPSHPWVPLYRGYQLFDDARYAEAFDTLSLVDQAYFASIDHHWRNVKTDELMLVSLIRDGQNTVKFSRLSDLTDRCAAAEIFDTPTPTEIVKTLSLSENRIRFDSFSGLVAREAYRLLCASGCTKVFPEEFAALQSASQCSE